MAELQLAASVSGYDESTRATLQTQISNWERSLEHLFCQRFRAQCYFASLNVRFSCPCISPNCLIKFKDSPSSFDSFAWDNINIGHGADQSAAADGLCDQGDQGEAEATGQLCADGAVCAHSRPQDAAGERDQHRAGAAHVAQRRLQQAAPAALAHQHAGLSPRQGRCHCGLGGGGVVARASVADRLIITSYSIGQEPAPGSSGVSDKLRPPSAAAAAAALRGDDDVGGVFDNTGDHIHIKLPKQGFTVLSWFWKVGGGGILCEISSQSLITERDPQDMRARDAIHLVCSLRGDADRFHYLRVSWPAAASNGGDVWKTLEAEVCVVLGREERFCSAAQKTSLVSAGHHPANARRD